MLRTVINGAVGWVARTITARYFKNSVANFLRHDGMGNTGVIVIYDSENRQMQVDALRICGGVASTIKTSNHRELNRVAPKGGRGEMGVLVIYETKKGKYTAISARCE